MSTLPARFLAKVEKTETCWFWMGEIDRDGYGRHWSSGKRVAAHRYSYEVHVGPIPEGLTIDHLCRVTSCVKPEHLEPVTLAENVRREWAARELPSGRREPVRFQPRLSHCAKGHALDAANTVVRATTRAVIHECRTCRNARKRRYRVESRSALA